jgi:phage gpG-like protein
MPTTITLPREDLRVLRAYLDAVAERLGSPRPFLERAGVVTLAAVAENFRRGGVPAWRPLAPLTLAARRGGQGGRPLVDTGSLRDSWDMEVTERRLVVFSRAKVAVYHQFGTRPHQIRPRNPSGWLTIPLGPRAPLGLGRGRPFLIAEPSRQGWRRRHAAEGERGRRGAVLFVRVVNHPGVPARPMLPAPRDLMPKLLATARQLLALPPPQGRP